MNERDDLARDEECICKHYVVDYSDPERYHTENVDREDDPDCPVHGDHQTLLDLARELHQMRFPTHGDCTPKPVEIEDARRVLSSDWLAVREKAAADKARAEGWLEGVKARSAWYGEGMPPNPYARADAVDDQLKSTGLPTTGDSGLAATGEQHDTDKTCPTCDGTGWVTGWFVFGAQSQPCPDCDGAERSKPRTPGRLVSDRALDAPVPSQPEIETS